MSGKVHVVRQTAYEKEVGIVIHTYDPEVDSYVPLANDMIWYNSSEKVFKYYDGVEYSIIDKAFLNKDPEVINDQYIDGLKNSNWIYDNTEDVEFVLSNLSNGYELNIQVLNTNFVNLEGAKVTLPPLIELTDGSYFNVFDANDQNEFRVWFDLEGDGSGEPQLNGSTALPVKVSQGTPRVITLESFDVPLEVSGVGGGTPDPIEEAFVAITEDYVTNTGYIGYISYSTNGINWSIVHSIPVGHVSVLFGGGKFVALGRTNSYSYDGINWTDTSSPYTARQIVYANGKFVGVGGFHIVGHSTDGIDWTEEYLPSNARANRIAFGNNMFVAIPQNVGDSTGAYSTNGVDWTALNLPYLGSIMEYGGQYRDIAFASGYFLIVLNKGNSYYSPSSDFMYSTDGVNWTSGGWNLDKRSLTSDGEFFYAYNPSGADVLKFKVTSNGIDSAILFYKAPPDGTLTASGGKILSYSSLEMSITEDGSTWYGSDIGGKFQGSPYQQLVAYGGGEPPQPTVFDEKIIEIHSPHNASKYYLYFVDENDSGVVKEVNHTIMASNGWEGVKVKFETYDIGGEDIIDGTILASNIATALNNLEYQSSGFFPFTATSSSNKTHITDNVVGISPNPYSELGFIEVYSIIPVEPSDDISKVTDKVISELSGTGSFDLSKLDNDKFQIVNRGVGPSTQPSSPVLGANFQVELTSVEAGVTLESDFFGDVYVESTDYLNVPYKTIRIFNVKKIKDRLFITYNDYDFDWG